VFTWLIGITGDPLAPVWYVTAMNVVSVLATVLLRPAPEPGTTSRFAVA